MTTHLIPYSCNRLTQEQASGRLVILSHTSIISTLFCILIICISTNTYSQLIRSLGCNQLLNSSIFTSNQLFCIQYAGPVHCPCLCSGNKTVTSICPALPSTSIASDMELYNFCTVCAHQFVVKEMFVTYEVDN